MTISILALKGKLNGKILLLSFFFAGYILTLSSHWYEKNDKVSPSIILAGRALLLKMLITLEPDGIFGSNFVYLCI